MNQRVAFHTLSAPEREGDDIQVQLVTVRLRQGTLLSPLQLHAHKPQLPFFTCLLCFGDPNPGHPATGPYRPAHPPLPLPCPRLGKARARRGHTVGHLRTTACLRAARAHATCTMDASVVAPAPHVPAWHITRMNTLHASYDLVASRISEGRKKGAAALILSTCRFPHSWYRKMIGDKQVRRGVRLCTHPPFRIELTQPVTQIKHSVHTGSKALQTNRFDGTARRWQSGKLAACVQGGTHLWPQNGQWPPPGSAHPVQLSAARRWGANTESCRRNTPLSPPYHLWVDPPGS